MDDSSPKSKILQFFTAHPLLGFIGCLGSLASIIALPFVLFPSLTTPRKDLSFCVNPVRTPIVQIDKQSDVSVSYRGKPVNGNVTAMQIAIWNAGREPIKGDDILDPIILRTGTNQIMEASILKATRSVSEFQIASNNVAPAGIGMKWRILEENDGVLLQIVCSGDTNVPVTLNGVLVGQPYPHEVPQPKLRRMKSFILVGLLIGVSMCSGAITTIAIMFKIVGKDLQSLSRPAWLRILVLLIVVFVFFNILELSRFPLNWLSQKLLTPFGF